MESSPKRPGPEKSSTSFSEEDGTLSLEAKPAPSWGLELTVGMLKGIDKRRFALLASNLQKWSAAGEQ